MIRICPLHHKELEIKDQLSKKLNLLLYIICSIKEQIKTYTGPGLNILFNVFFNILKTLKFVLRGKLHKEKYYMFYILNIIYV